VWWLRLGIDIERIKPGHPQQNGRHERMRLTLKQDATKPASKNFLQQARFDEFIRTFMRPLLVDMRLSTCATPPSSIRLLRALTAA